MAELMSRRAGSIKPLQKGQTVEGTVKKLTPSEILLDIGAKGDALVLEYDKKNLSNLLSILHVGDKVSASVISAESEEGFPVVSLRRMLDNIVFSGLEKEYKSQLPIEVVVTEVGRGGYFAEGSSGVKGFLPNSQVLSNENLVGKTIQAKIIEFDREKKRIILSQKATVYVTDPSEIEKHVKKDSIVEVTVQAVTPHGLYVLITLPKDVLIEGFIHVSEISYQRVEDLSSLYKKGDSIKAQVIEMDRENRRLNLSVKRLEKDTFSDVKAKYTKDAEVKAVVTDVKSRGVTVEIEPKVIGFIQASKIPSGTTFEKGQEITAQVADYDENHRMILLVPVLTTKFVGYR